MLGQPVKKSVTLDEQSLLPSLDQPFYRDEHLFVHLRHQVVMLDGEAITLTRKQYQVLAL